MDVPFYHFQSLPNLSKCLSASHFNVLLVFLPFYPWWPESWIERHIEDTWSYSKGARRISKITQLIEVWTNLTSSSTPVIQKGGFGHRNNAVESSLIFKKSQEGSYRMQYLLRHERDYKEFRRRSLVCQTFSQLNRLAWWLSCIDSVLVNFLRYIVLHDTLLYSGLVNPHSVKGKMYILRPHKPVLIQSENVWLCVIGN